MILIAYRHGLRAAEVVDLRWDQVDLGRNAALHVRRVKQGLPSVHPLQGDEMRGAARIEAVINLAIRVHVRAGRTIHHSGLRQNGREGGS